jgi:hypothetical protein
MENLTTHGLLVGTDYAVGDNYRGVWGLYANHDYLAPQIFRLSATSLSLGTTGQWWLSQNFALRGTGLAGFGYAAASTVHGVADDRDYHYGMAPRIGLALRMIAGDRASVDVSGQAYLLGRIINRAAGRDDISRVDAAFTWRVHGRHAIGAKYVWSHRCANYPAIGDRRQTLGMAGVYYTLLGEVPQQSSIAVEGDREADGQRQRDADARRGQYIRRPMYPEDEAGKRDEQRPGERDAESPSA